VVPETQSVHTRFTLAVGAVLWYLPAIQSTATAVQVALLSAVEKVVPLVQAVHWRSTMVLPAVVSPCPAGQVAHVAHAV